MESTVAGCIEVVWGKAILPDMRLGVDVRSSSEERHPGERKRKVQKN